MKQLVTITAVALAATMAAPSALAWYGYGSNEPNSHYDSSAYMFQDGPGSDANRVYFNVVTGIGGPGLGYPGVTPNSAMLGSRIESEDEGFTAVLGVWADCNHDGYIGLADGAMREYRAEVSSAAGHPVDTTLCPAVPDVPPTSPSYQGPIHNSNGWITEMLPIGASDLNHGQISTDHRTIYDPLAKVWGDNLEPRTADATAQGSCTTLFGSGQSRTTGGILDHVDCLDGKAPDTARDALAAIVPTLGALPDPSSLYGAGGPGNVPEPAAVGGSDESHNSFVSGEQDCSKDPTVDTTSVSKQPNQPWGKSGIRPVGQPKPNANGDVAGTVNETREESAVDDCNASDDYGHDWYGNFESAGPDSTTASGQKTQADYNFQFRQWNNRQGTANGGCGTGATGALCGTPGDAGVPEAYVYAGVGSNMWTTGFTIGQGPRTGLPGVAQLPDVAKGSYSASLAPGNWFTFYASISVSGLELPGAGGTYGTEWCTSGIGPNAPSEHGWACDGALWNLDAFGNKVIDPNFYHATVGDGYNLRDVDCYDTTLVGASASPTHGDVGAHSVPVATRASDACS